MSEPISVLYISSVAQMGGAEMSLADMVGRLNRTRFRPHLLVAGEGALANRFRQMGAPVVYGSFPFISRRQPWTYAAALLHIVRQVRRFHADVIHVNCDRAVPHAVVAGRLANVPVLCSIHDMVRAWYLPSYVRHLNSSACIVANSQATARHCLAAGMRPDRLQVIYECVELQPFSGDPSSARQSLRSAWRLPADALAIGLVGQVLKYKGHEDFLAAAGSLLPEFPQATFVIVGDDALSDSPAFLPSLRTLVAHLGIADHVIFAGFRGDIPSVMAALDIVTVPSHTEAFGRVVVEALAASRPVVATAVGGIPEILTHEQIGVLVPPHDSSALAGALMRLCLDEDLRQRLAAAGPEAAARFDARSIARGFERIYGALANRAGSLDAGPVSSSAFA